MPTNESETTQPNLKARLQAANVKADPWIDRALLWAAASGWSPVIIGAAVLVVFCAGLWAGTKL